MAEPTAMISNGFKIEKTISVGNLLTLFGMCIAATVAYADYKASTASMQEKILNEAAIRSDADKRHDSELQRLRSDIRSDLTEIKTELRNLRDDISRKPQK